MALSHVTKVYGIKMAKIYKLTADVPGSPPTYGTGVQVVGAKELILTPEWDEKELRGDNTLLDADAVLTGLKGELKFGKLSLDVLNVLTGSTVTDTGVTPNQLSKYSLLSADKPSYFKIDAQAVDADPIAGDVHYVLWKCKCAALPLGLAEENYQAFSFSFVAMPVLGTGLNWMDISLNETAIAPA